MESYLISYDLSAPGRDYEKIADKIKSFGTWAKPLESVWLLRSSTDISVIKDQLADAVDANDSIFVVKVTGLASWQNLHPDVSNWIKLNL